LWDVPLRYDIPLPDIHLWWSGVWYLEVEKKDAETLTRATTIEPGTYRCVSVRSLSSDG